MVKVRFYDEVEDSLLKFAVMIARHDGKMGVLQTPETGNIRGAGRTPGARREDRRNS